jgi:CARDB protein/matrixin
MKRGTARGLLTLSALLIAGAVWFTATTRASDNLDFLSAGVIRDAFWDSRLFDGTPEFPGFILWYHKPTGKPTGVNQTEFEARLETAFDTWDAVDAGIAGPPLVPIVNFGGQTSAPGNPLTLDGINMVGWKAEGAGGNLAITPCYVLTEPTTTIAGPGGNTVMPISGGQTIPFPGPVGVTYPAGALIDCGIQFDSSDSWSTSTPPGIFSFDVQSVATHEGGHFIGLSHSTLGDFTAANPMSATMLPAGAQGDANLRTLEEDDKASVLRTYARNRNGGSIAQTVGGRGLIELTLLKGGTCQPATGLSVVAYKTSTGIDGLGRVETFSGSHLRLGILDEPVNGSVALNVLPLPAGESYTIYARTLEEGLGLLSSQRYNSTTINANLLDPVNGSRRFDQLAVVNAIGAGDTIDLGNVGIAGCWLPNPASSVDVVADSVTAPSSAFLFNQIAVTSSIRNQGSSPTGPFDVGIYFSTDPTINADDIFSGLSCPVADLLPGATTTCDGLADVPGMAGDYYVGVLADIENEVVESVENNNGVAAGNLTTVVPNPLDPIVNGSFETGDLTGWTVKELQPASNPSLPISVRGAGVEYPAPTFLAFPYILDYFTSAPTHGQWAALHDFNGNDPATTGFINRRELYQDITLPPGTTTLEFDYRAAWELFRFGSTQDRTFDVEIEPAGGGATLLAKRILTAFNAGFEEDTDNPSGGSEEYPLGIVDLNAFSGQSVRLKFVWNIPEPGTGFGFFQLDKIHLNTAPNATPVVTIVSPDDGATFAAGASIPLSATATDTEDGDISANISWSSSLDGPIGTGASLLSALSAGTHTVTASVTDSAQGTGSASITLTVSAPPNSSPTVDITAPLDGSTFVAGTLISFAGSASDAEDGNLSALLAWSSSLDGSIGTGASVSTAALRVGTHTITASAVDTDMATGVDSITLTVDPVPPTDVTNVATADFATALGTIVSGNFEDTWAEDDVYEVLIEEVQGSGSVSRRRSLLEHTWTFNVVAGAQYVFTVSAHHDGTEDAFTFAYSRDNVAFTPMLTVTATTDTDLVQSYVFPADVRGAVYVRVQDTDRTRGNVQQDRLFVDYLAITTTGSAPPLPSITLSAVGRKVQGIEHADLTWSGATTATVIITRNGQPIAASPVPNSGAYTDNIGTKGSGSYTYQVCESDLSACSNLATVTF